jgi:hypothetical protein
LENLYGVIAECLNVLIEELDCGDIDLPEFSAKVERILGRTPLNHVSPQMGLEWDIVDGGFNLYYAAPEHRAVLSIRYNDEGKFVHGTIDHDEAEEETAEQASSSVDKGCGDPECENCSPMMDQIRELLKPMKVVADPGIPRGVIISFGPLKWDAN